MYICHQISNNKSKGIFQIQELCHPGTEKFHSRKWIMLLRKTLKGQLGFNWWINVFICPMKVVIASVWEAGTLLSKGLFLLHLLLCLTLTRSQFNTNKSNYWAKQKFSMTWSKSQRTTNRAFSPHHSQSSFKCALPRSFHWACSALLNTEMQFRESTIAQWNDATKEKWPLCTRLPLSHLPVALTHPPAPLQLQAT